MLIHFVEGSNLAMLNAYLRLTRLNRPIGIFLVLWPALWSLWLASGGLPDPKLLAIFIAGSVLMRSAGCVINDFADRKIDGQVARTRDRPMATGEIAPLPALTVFVVLLFLAFILVLFTNALTIQLAVVGALLAAAYPFAKRYTQLPQLVLGAAFAWAVPMAFASASGSVPTAAWLLFCVVLVWTTAYDTFYAMVDREDDERAGIKSLAVLLGDMDQPMTACLQATVVAGLLLVGARFELGAIYQGSVALTALLFMYQQYLIRRDPKAGAFKAFLNNGWVGALLLAGIALDLHFAVPVS